METPNEVKIYLALEDYLSDTYDDMSKDDNTLICKVIDFFIRTIYEKGYDKYFDGEE